MKNTFSISMKLSGIVALLGCMLTLIQALLLVGDREGICLNEGCDVVDSLTTIPPLFVNMAGFLFFLTVILGLWLARHGDERRHYVRALLLAGLAVEGVLVSFQHVVAQTFCSYCLIIFTLVVVLNLLAGWRHFFTGAVVFLAVITGFAGLQFVGAEDHDIERLGAGTLAALPGAEMEKRYFFFSSTCPHCEEVLAELRNGDSCAIRFQPIDKIADFPLERADVREVYKPEVNRDFLRALGIERIPTLVVSRGSGFEVIGGASPILRYLEAECIEEEPPSPSNEGYGPSAGTGLDGLLPLDEACSIEVDCEEPEAQNKPGDE